MDIKEIERLHAQYAAPPVTIEMDASGTASLDAASAPAASQLPGKRNGAIVARIKPIHWQCLGILTVAVLAFGGGRWLASGDSHKLSEKSVAAQPETAAPSVDNGREWPASQPSVSQPPAALGTPTIAPSADPVISSGASASTPTAAAPQSVARPQPKAQTPKQSASISTAARQAPTTPAPIHPPAPAAGRGNEIKLF